MLMCGCNCGEPIPPKAWHRFRPPKFIPGHHHRRPETGRSWSARQPNADETPSGICECGCGSPTPIAAVTVRARGVFAGHPTKCLPGHAKKRPKQRNTSGRVMSKQGYVRIKAPEHPHAWGKTGYVAEHRLVMESVLGRYLRPEESVHHKNGIRHDNRPENLELWVKPQMSGQRPEDLVAWVVESYPELVREALGRT